MSEDDAVDLGEVQATGDIMIVHCAWRGRACPRPKVEQRKEVAVFKDGANDVLASANACVFLLIFGVASARNFVRASGAEWEVVGQLFLDMQQMSCGLMLSPGGTEIFLSSNGDRKRSKISEKTIVSSDLKVNGFSMPYDQSMKAHRAR